MKSKEQLNHVLKLYELVIKGKKGDVEKYLKGHNSRDWIEIRDVLLHKLSFEFELGNLRAKK